MTDTITGADPTALPIVIEQDYEIEDDGEVGGPLAVFWTAGHGHDEHDVIRAVVEHCLAEGRDIPRIDGDHGPVEVWQTTLSRGDSIEYRRAATREGLPPYTRAADITPVTLLDLDARARGAAICSIRDCRRPRSTGTPVRAVVAPTDGGAGVNDRHVSVEVWLCREHRGTLPDPYYRVCLVPVGAKILLPAPEGDEPQGGDVR